MCKISCFFIKLKWDKGFLYRITYEYTNGKNAFFNFFDRKGRLLLLCG